MACCTTRERINLNRWLTKKPPEKPPILAGWPEDLYVYTPSSHAPRLNVGDEYFDPHEAEWLNAKMSEFLNMREAAIEKGMRLSSTEEINEEVAKLRVNRVSES